MTTLIHITKRLSTVVSKTSVPIRWLSITLALTILAATMAAIHIEAFPALSRSDEYVYIDAVDKATRGVITRQGAPIDDYALNLISCRGIELYGPQGSACGEPIDRSLFPWNGGHTSADIHSPVYFFVTAFLAKPIMALTGASLLPAARLTGALWLGTGLAVFIALARALGADRSMSGLVAILFLASPMVRWTNFYVTPDAFNVLCGSAIMLSAVQYSKGKWHAWPFVLIGAASAAIKGPLVFGVVAASIFMIGYSILERSTQTRSPRQAITTGLLASTSALLVEFTYLRIRAMIAIESQPAIDQVRPFSLSYALSQAENFISFLYEGSNAIHGSSLAAYGTPGSIPAISGLVVAAGLISLAFFPLSSVTPLQRRFAQATAACLVFLGPALYVYVNISTGTAFDLDPRYGMVLMGGYMACLACIDLDRMPRLLLACLASFGVVLALVQPSLQ